MSRQELVVNMIATLSMDNAVMAEFLKFGSKFDTEFLSEVEKAQLDDKPITPQEEETEDVLVESDSNSTVILAATVGILAIGAAVLYKKYN